MARGERLPLAANYSVAVLLAVVAQLTRLPLHSPTLIPYITYAPFILLAAFRGGLGPGLLATILCTVESLYYATEPVETFRVQDPQHWLGLGALALTGVVASLLFGRLKEARIAAAAGDQVRGALALELEARRRMLESVIEHSPVSIALLRGRDFRFETVNPAYQALAPGEPMAGRTVVEVWPEAAPVVVPLLEEVRDHRNVYHATALAVPLHRGPGLAPEERYFDFTYVPLPGTSSEGQAETGQVLVVAIEVTEQQRDQQARQSTLRELESALAEKTVLLKEVHHRVKNNLAVIVSLLGMKAEAIESDEVREALEDSQQRVRSIAMIHEHLYGTEHLDRISFAGYAEQLMHELGDVYGVAARGIAIRVEAEPIEMGLHRAVPCALILNELVTNALKHAFPVGRGGEVRVSLKQSAPEELELSVEDNGVGCPRVVPARSGKSMGLRIVGILAKQVEGSLEQQECGGTRFVLRFRAGTSRRVVRVSRAEVGADG
ncbi:MAG: sensor histidine kinase [Bryobacteraceae bacterium]